MTRWKKAQDSAINAKLEDGEATDLLAHLRAGDKSAAGELQKGLAWLLYEIAFDWANGSGKRRPDDVIGSLYLGLQTAIGRIAKSNATDPVTYVRQELSRRLHAYRKENDRNIKPSRQANRYRERQGLPLYETLSRVECTPHEEVEMNPLEQVEYKGPDLEDEYHAYRGPSKHYNADDDVNLVDLFDQLADDPELRAVAELTLQRYTIADITSALNISEYRVRGHRDELRRRLSNGDGTTLSAVQLQLTHTITETLDLADLELALAV